MEILKPKLKGLNNLTGHGAVGSCGQMDGACRQVWRNKLGEQGPDGIGLCKMTLKT